MGQKKPRGWGGQGKVQGLKPVLVVYVSTHRKCFRHTTTLGSAIIKSRFLLSNGYFKFLRDSLISSSLQHELPPHDAKNRLTGRDPDAGKDWRQEEKGMIEGEMVGWHRWLDGNEFGQELVMDREAWRAAVHVRLQSQTRLNSAGWTAWTGAVTAPIFRWQWQGWEVSWPVTVLRGTVVSCQMI